jgi:two-component system NarL family response regulator
MNVLLADYHPLFLDGLKNLLSARGVQVLGTARSGSEALEKARRLHPDVILMDIQMPGCDGLVATRLIKAEMPEIKIVMLTMASDDDDLFNAIKSGACGYLLKTQDTDEFFAQLLEMERGEAPLAPGMAARILNEFRLRTGRVATQEGLQRQEQLSPRQLAVLALVAQGLTYKQVGTELCLSERTIKYHMGEVIARLHLENRAEVIQYAKSTGLVKS